MNLSAEERTDLLVKQELDRVNLFVGSSCSFLFVFWWEIWPLGIWLPHRYLLFLPLVLHVYFSLF